MSPEERALTYNDDKMGYWLGRYDDVIKNPTLREKYLALTKDQDLSDQRDDLALLRAMSEVMIEKCTALTEGTGEKELDNAVEAQKILRMTSMIEKVTNLIDKITAREQRLKYMVHFESVTGLIDKFTEIITRHITDEAMVHRIVSELTAQKIETKDPVHLLEQ